MFGKIRDSTTFPIIDTELPVKIDSYLQFEGSRLA